jgi:hypothetical protein
MTAGMTEEGWRTTEELRALSTEYATAADERDGERFAGLFVEGGELVVPNLPDDPRPVLIRSGHQALRRVPEMLRRYDRTFHLVSNHRYHLEDETASGEVQCVAHHVTAGDRPADGEGTDTLWFIRYRDDYRRTGSGWRFVRRELHLQWIEEHRVTIFPVPASGRPG